MKKKFIGNAFSIQMLQCNSKIQFYKISPEIVAIWMKEEEYVWAIGHQDTSRLVSSILGLVPKDANRIDVKLNTGDQLVVAQFTGGRLPEGCTTLPEGCKLEFWVADVT